MQHLDPGPAAARPGATGGGAGPGPAGARRRAAPHAPHDAVPPAAIAGPPPVVLSPDEAERLLALARVAVRVASGAAPEGALIDAIAAGPLPERLGAAFVTLTAYDGLRGCIGLMEPERPAWVSVVGAARSAAVRDPRFPPLGTDELDGLEIAVSVLGPVVRIEDPGAFRPGTHGIIVRRGDREALLLPEVAEHLGGEAIAMLAACCRKAGLPASAWREPGTELAVFRTARVEGRLIPDR